MRGHAGRVLVAQQVPAQARLGPLGILELDDPRPLDRLLADAEQARGHLRDHVVLVRDEALGIAAFAGAGEAVEGLGHPGLAQQHADVGRAERHAAAVPGHVDGDLGPRIVRGGSAASVVEMSSRRRAAGGAGGEAEPQAVEPAARAAHLLSRCCRRRLARLRHVPVADQQVGRPAAVAQRLEGRVLGQRQGLPRARRRRIAVRPDAHSGPMQR